MPMGCFIGIDQGSSATKTVAVSSVGQILFQIRKDLPAPLRDGERIEQETGFRTVPTLEIGGKLYVNPSRKEMDGLFQL